MTQAKSAARIAYAYAEVMRPLLARVLERDRILFLAAEKKRLHELVRFPDEELELLGRLLCRRDSWLRKHSFMQYPLSDLNLSLKNLCQDGLLEQWPDSSKTEPPPRELIESLGRKTLLHLLQEEASLSKTELLERLRPVVENCGEGFPVEPDRYVQLQLWPAEERPLERLRRMDTWYRVKEWPLLRLVLTADSGHVHVSLKEYLLQHLGIQRVAARNCPAAPLFRQRSSLNLLQEAEEKLEQGLDLLSETPEEGLVSKLACNARTIESACNTARLDKDPELQVRLENLLASFRHACAQSLERAGRFSSARRLYKQNLELPNQRRLWRDSLRRILVDTGHLEGRKSAQDLASFYIPICKSRVLVRELELRVGQNRELPDEVRQTCHTVLVHPGWKGGKALFQGQKGAALTVESWALEHFRSQGWNGVHAESRLLNALAGMLGWPLLYAEIPGVFRNRFQLAPDDWKEPGFLLRRRPSWQEQIKQVLRGRMQRILSDGFREYAELNNPLIAWRWLLENHEAHMAVEARKALRVLAAGLDSRQLLLMCHRILANPVDARSGAPDLFLWRVNQGTLEMRFCEIKGPGDSLQANQRLWIEFLSRIGLTVELFRVKRTGSPDATGPVSG